MLLASKHKGPVKIWHLVLFALIILAAIGTRLYARYWPTGIVRIGGQELKVWVADNDRHRFRGLSDRRDLGGKGGMLFVFPVRSQHTMVMREMNFPLDIVWLDGNTIVDIAPNLPPEPGRPESELTPYPGRAPSTKVLELPAGFTATYVVAVGDTVTIAY